MTCKIIMVSAYVATIAAALAFMGCNPCERVAHDSAGNEMCADSVIQSYELDGMWCTFASPEGSASGMQNHDPGPALCLQVQQSPSQPWANYLLSQGHQCFEHGRLTGGLEFDPDTTSDTCFPGVVGPFLWTASGEWTATGLTLTGNQIEPVTLEFHYVR